MVSETNLFPLDTIVINDEDSFDSKKSGYHLPALYFLSGLTKLNQFPLHLLKSSIGESLHQTTEELEQVRNDMSSGTPDFVDNIFPEIFNNLGAACTRNFLQILFESQSRDLTTKLFAKERLVVFVDGPLSCYVTAWCIANSDPTSQWNVWFFKGNECRIEDFVNHLQNFGDSSYQHGEIIGLYLDKPFDHLHPSTVAQLPSFFSHLQSFIFMQDKENINPGLNLSPFLPLFACFHKLTSLKTFLLGSGGLLPSAASLLPQHCPSLSTIIVFNPGLFRPLVVPNLNTLTFILCSLTSTDLSSLCIGLQQTRSLKELHIATDLNIYEEVKALGCALNQNRSLKCFTISLPTITHGIELLKQILSCHPTVEQYGINGTDEGTSVDPTSDYDDDMKLALAMSQLEYKEGETHAAPQENHISGDDDLELALAMSLSLEMAEEERRKRDEEKEKKDLEQTIT